MQLMDTFLQQMYPDECLLVENYSPRVALGSKSALPNIRAGPMCAQEKEKSEMTGREAEKNMKQKAERKCV